MVLLISLVLLLLLMVLGLSSMQGATSQEQLAGSLRHRNQSFQAAESGLRRGESAVQAQGFGLPPCQSLVTCAPPKEAYVISRPGVDPVSAVTWVGMKAGIYGIQNLGVGIGLAHLPPDTPATLYRVTAVGISGQSRSVLESVYARVASADDAGERFRRILWRQLQ
ncbi:type IV pilus assembly protein PilX [Pseudomonas sp. FH4]|jgi:type IV pilus assembly protein PilX|uniref:pilus assembly PilX family protein n=1 Tax=Pseudomonas TaxID=286 RepID=UPI0003DC8C8A|nr:MULTISPECIES: PilX N-terminal domain-containing pilus assembly protein [Pseudomonas]MDZ4301454.1 PilX N-terminal domain-containing pilus assembly protein [Pseudomonas sp.]ETK16821.1 type IV pilus assembly protein PilX [Pseudomonas sp. FH4]MBF8007217.1 pilus assembly protein PilX [Pseudomonas brenneri]WJM90641.1 PilX N-terminal domain-containing pilus assembly protein [Pseudomonas brenneri]CRM83204.1 Tfp pilus assembly protein PilX [Pseudomonas sp. 25 R 14]